MESQETPESRRRSFFQVRDLTRIHAPVRDVERSARWYGDILGLEEVCRTGSKTVFLRSGGSLSLVLEKVSGRRSIPRLCFAFRVSGGSVALEAWRQRLKKLQVPYSLRTVENRIGGVFLTDPDGHMLEIVSD